MLAAKTKAPAGGAARAFKKYDLLAKSSEKPATMEVRKKATPQHSPTMTSREVADLTGKRHDNAMQDIQGMLVELGGILNFQDTYNQLKFTPKGVVWVAGEWAEHQIQGGAQ